MTEDDFQDLQDDILDAMDDARSRGLRPTQLRLGIKQEKKLMNYTDVLISSNTSLSQKSAPHRLMGMEVDSVGGEHMRVMIAQEDDRLEYSIF